LGKSIVGVGVDDRSNDSEVEDKLRENPRSSNILMILGGGIKEKIPTNELPPLESVLNYEYKI